MISINNELSKKYLWILASCIFFIAVILFLPPNLSWVLKATIGVTGAAILLWVTQPVPLAVTSIIVLVALPLLNIFPLNSALMGYSNSSTFLLMAGFMMAQGVNSTQLSKRFINFIVTSFGGSLKGVLFGVILAPSVLGIFIPSNAVRTAILLPVILTMTNLIGSTNNKNTVKILVLGLTFGATVSGVPFIPAAISNILTVDLLRNIGIDIYYFTWFKIAWPIWLLMTPITWAILLKVFPSEIDYLDISVLKKELDELGGFTLSEKKCSFILILTVVLWMTESIHHLPTAVPALLAVILMVLPGVGITDWNTLKNIDWGTVLLMGAMLSLAIAINDSGAAEYFANLLLMIPGIKSGLSSPIIAVIILSVLTQIYHLGVTNVATVVLTLTPIILEIALKLNFNPLLAALVVNMSALMAFLLVVETMPSVITYATETYTNKDMLRAGFWLTLASILVIIITSLVWWPIIGLI